MHVAVRRLLVTELPEWLAGRTDGHCSVAQPASRAAPQNPLWASAWYHYSLRAAAATSTQSLAKRSAKLSVLISKDH